MCLTGHLMLKWTLNLGVKRVKCSKLTVIDFVCVCEVVVNGVAAAPGDQDTEDTELMAIYTKERQVADKVSYKLVLCFNL